MVLEALTAQEHRKLKDRMEEHNVKDLSNARNPASST